MRNYKKEYADYHSKPEQKKRRAGRNKARRISGLKKGDKRDVHHKDNNPRNNKKSNLQVMSRSKNRSMK